MISLFLVLSIIALAVLVIITTVTHNWVHDSLKFATFFLALAVITLGIRDAQLCYDVMAKPQIIEQKISMCQEENQIIEEKIDALVKDYMQYENETYSLFHSESLIELISLFPDLKSDNLVSQQIQVYLANEQEIKNLKQELIELQRSKWLLYFGS